MADDATGQVDTVRTLVGSMADGAVAVADAGDAVAVNDAVLDALAPDRERGGVRGEDAEALLGAAVPAQGERVVLDGPDDRRVFEASGSVVEDVAGVERLVVLREVTEHRRRLERVLVLERVLRHALRDEMTGVLGRAEYVRDAIQETEVLSEAHGAADAVVEATRSLADLGETAWAVEEVFADGGPETTGMDLVMVVQKLLDAASEDHPGVKVDSDMPASAVVEAPATVETALEAVVESACERNEAPVPRLDVTVERNGDVVTVDVADNGSGIDDRSAAMLEHGEEPPLAQDGGLDRWLAHWVVDAAGGTVSVGENVPRGTVITIELPAAEG
jgi:signal transduction histidine kinase